MNDFIMKEVYKGSLPDQPVSNAVLGPSAGDEMLANDKQKTDKFDILA